MVDATLKIIWSEKIECRNDNLGSIPSTGGVYEIQGRKTSDGGYTRRYVGKSDNLKATYSEYLLGHAQNQKLNQFLKEKKSFFRFVKINSDSIRKDLEKGLYSKYKHSLVDAKHIPSGSGKYLKISVEETNQ
ncbi:MAG TPA: hypothetical protein VJ792_03810 [Candidatus Nitrosotalea sp.]|nr:hypothetical protein [Candidatus Nitrosotalea sp.]